MPNLDANSIICLVIGSSRPHQGIGQNVPCEPPANVTESAVGKIISLPVLNGLHHAYRRAA